MTVADLKEKLNEILDYYRIGRFLTNHDGKNIVEMYPVVTCTPIDGQGHVVSLLDATEKVVVIL